MKQSQFRTLYRVFLLRVVDLELLSTDGDPTRLLGQFAALLSAISLAFCLPLFLIGRTTPEIAWGAEHVLIALTMVVIGLISILSWDSIFPDRRDVLVLAPLPVPSRTVFIAKAAALAYAASLAFFALNIFTGFFWALCFSPSNSLLGVLRSVAAYWTTTAVAGAFMFLSVIAFQGAVSQLLPRQLFLRISAPIQMACFCLFLSMYILEPSLESPQLLAAPQNQSLLAWLPSYWFFGIFQQLNGTNSPASQMLAGRAWLALFTAVCGAAAALAISFLRTLRKVAEQPEILPLSRQTSSRFSTTSSFPSAIVHFCLRTLFRSRQHRIILSFYIGVGMALVMAYLKILFVEEPALRATAFTRPGTPLIASSILILCFNIAGLRIVSALPISVRANWVFRVTEVHSPDTYLAAVRRAFILLGAVPIFSISSLVLLTLWPWRPAVEHLAVLALLGLILAELCLPGFKKIPFTCSYLPGSGNLQYIFWIGLLVILPLIGAASRFELQTLDRPTTYAAMIVALVISLTLARWRTAVALRPVKRMLFDEVEPDEMLSLNLDQSWNPPASSAETPTFPQR